MKVWRLERIGGYGPFVESCMPVVDDSELHPIPSRDGLRLDIIYQTDWVFGCPSLEILKSWFDPYKEEIYEIDDFVVKVFDVPEPSDDEYFYVMGNSQRQVMFNKDASIFIEQFPL